MDFEALVYEKTSPWQNIRIMRTRMSGNALFLDGDASWYFLILCGYYQPFCFNFVSVV